MSSASYVFFFFNDTATTEIYTLSLHDALPICIAFDARRENVSDAMIAALYRNANADAHADADADMEADRKSTRLNSSHLVISYAVFCLKKKKIHAVDSVSTQPLTPCLRQH